MTERWLWVTATCVMSCALASCSADRSVSANISPCDGPLTITVTSGRTPTFDWTPHCGVNRLIVLPANPPVGLITQGWTVSSAVGLFKAPITYGVLPNGADRGDAATPLVPGTTYQVIIYRAAYEAIAASSGSATFTP